MNNNLEKIADFLPVIAVVHTYIIFLVIISQLRCFLTFAGQSFNILIVLRASGLKATSSEA